MGDIDTIHYSGAKGALAWLWVAVSEKIDPTVPDTIWQYHNNSDFDFTGVAFDDIVTDGSNGIVAINASGNDSNFFQARYTVPSSGTIV